MIDRIETKINCTAKRSHYLMFSLSAGDENLKNKNHTVMKEYQEKNDQLIESISSYLSEFNPKIKTFEKCTTQISDMKIYSMKGLNIYIQNNKSISLKTIDIADIIGRKYPICIKVNGKDHGFLFMEKDEWKIKCGSNIDLFNNETIAMQNNNLATCYYRGQVRFLFINNTS